MVSRSHHRDRRKNEAEQEEPKSANTGRAKATNKIAPQQTSAGKARAEGMRLFKLAGRPTGEQFVLVYGERGPKMAWQERAKAG